MTFTQYWRQVKLDQALLNLDQKKIEAVRKMMNMAYRAGYKAAGNGKG